MSQQGQNFKELLRVQRFDNAAYFAGPLFQGIFQQPFPKSAGRGIAFVGAIRRFFQWDEEQIEPVGFCNFLPYENSWLEGGLCVRRYARLPPGLSEECRATGGVAQLIMEAAARNSMTVLRGLPMLAMYSHSRYARAVASKRRLTNMSSPSGSMSVRQRTKPHSLNASRHSGRSEALIL